MRIRLCGDRRLECVSVHNLGYTITETIMKDALAKIDDRKLLVKAPYMDFVIDLQYPRRDFDMIKS